MVGSPPCRAPTRRQLEVLRAYIATGSIALAAHRLEITETTASQHLSELYRRTGCVNVAQAAYMLGASDGKTSDSGLDGPVLERPPAVLR